MIDSDFWKIKYSLYFFVYNLGYGNNNNLIFFYCIYDFVKYSIFG